MAGRMQAGLLKVAGKAGDAYARHLNRRMERKNTANQEKGWAPHAPIEPVRPKSFESLFRSGVVYNPNRPGRCAAYATRIGRKYFGKNFVLGNAWFLAEKNRVTLRREAKKGGIQQEELTALIRHGKITPGTILGVFRPASPANKPGREFTHVMVYVGNDTFWHNFLGPRKITVEEIYSSKTREGRRKLIPLVVIEPKQ